MIARLGAETRRALLSMLKFSLRELALMKSSCGVVAAGVLASMLARPEGLRNLSARKHQVSWMESWASKSVLPDLASLWIAGTTCERTLISLRNSSAVA